MAKKTKRRRECGALCTALNDAGVCYGCELSAKKKQSKNKEPSMDHPAILIEKKQEPSMDHPAILKPKK